MLHAVVSPRFVSGELVVLARRPAGVGTSSDSVNGDEMPLRRARSETGRRAILRSSHILLAGSSHPRDEPAENEIPERPEHHAAGDDRSDDRDVAPCAVEGEPSAEQ